LPIEHFLFGLDQQGNYFFYKTDGVNAIITDENLHRLRENKESCEEAYWLPTEQLVAMQYITSITRNGRTGIWNHTQLIPINEYIRDNDPVAKYSRHFIKPNGDIPQHLEPINVEEHHDE